MKKISSTEAKLKKSVSLKKTYIFVTVLITFTYIDFRSILSRDTSLNFTASHVPRSTWNRLIKKLFTGLIGLILVTTSQAVSDQNLVGDPPLTSQNLAKANFSTNFSRGHGTVTVMINYNYCLMASGKLIQIFANNLWRKNVESSF